ALATRWRNEIGLHWAVLALGAALLARLVIPEFFIATASRPTLLAALFLPAAFAALVAGVMIMRTSSVAQTSMALSALIAAAFASLLARNLFTAGAIEAPYANLGEMALNTLIWLGFATGLAWRFGPAPRTHLYWLEAVVLGAAATHEFVAGIVALNPWWGLT